MLFYPTCAVHDIKCAAKGMRAAGWSPLVQNVKYRYA